MENEKQRPIFKKTRPWHQDINLDTNQDIKKDIPLPPNQDIFKDINLDINRDILLDSNLDNIAIVTRYKRDSNEIAEDINPDSNQIVTREPTRDNQDIQKDINQDTKRDINLLRHYMRTLIGHQKSIFEYVLDLSNLNDGFNSGFISTHEMANSINCTYSTAKITLFNMVKKEILIRHKGKGCRGGYIILEIPKVIKAFYLEFHQGMKQDSKRDIRPDKIENHYNNSNKTITIGEGWDEIDFKPLSHIGFEKETLLQVKNFSTPEIVQKSINYFAFALEHDEKVKKYESKLGALISQLKAGKAWQKHEKYKTPLEISIENLQREEASEKRREEELLKEMFETKFNNWFSQLSPDRQNKKTISDHQADFRKNDWPEIYQKIKK